MRVSQLLAVPCLITLAAGASAEPSKSAAQLLALIPAQAQGVVYYPDFRRMEAKWAKVVGHFGAKDGFLTLKSQAGIDPARLAPGPLARVGFSGKGTEKGAWLLPTKDPKALLEGLGAAHKNGVWTWASREEAKAKKAASKTAKATEATAWFASAVPGYLIIADSEAGLAAFKKPAKTLATELAPYAAWLEGHDVSVVATKAAVTEATQEMRKSFKASAEKDKEGGKTAPGNKLVSQFQAKLERWAGMAETSVHHLLGGLDLSEDGGVSFVAQALLTKGSPLSRELEALPPVDGHPLKGLGTSEFALALGGNWTTLFDFQTVLLESLDQGDKVPPATVARMKKSIETLSGLVRSWGGTFAAPAPRGSLLSGMTSLVRVSDTKAYLAALDESSQAQSAFFKDLGMAVDAVTYTRDILPGVPSCGVTTRLADKENDPATASTRMAMAMIFGGDAVQMSMAALDEHRLVMVLGGPELLKTRLEELKKASDGLAKSIEAVEPELGREHRFALYVDPRGVRNFAQVLAGMFGGGGKNLPEIPTVPAAGMTLSLDATALELRGAVKAETLKATATLVKAIGAMMPAKGAAEPAAEAGPDEPVAPAATPEPISEEQLKAEPKE
jgi:hypothetical protein